MSRWRSLLRLPPYTAAGTALRARRRRTSQHRFRFRADALSSSGPERVDPEHGTRTASWTAPTNTTARGCRFGSRSSAMPAAADRTARSPARRRRAGGSRESRRLRAMLQVAIEQQDVRGNRPPTLAQVRADACPLPRPRCHPAPPPRAPPRSRRLTRHRRRTPARPGRGRSTTLAIGPLAGGGTAPRRGREGQGGGGQVRQVGQVEGGWGRWGR